MRQIQKETVIVVVHLPNFFVFQTISVIITRENSLKKLFKHLSTALRSFVTVLPQLTPLISQLQTHMVRWDYSTRAK